MFALGLEATGSGGEWGELESVCPSAACRSAMQESRLQTRPLHSLRELDLHFHGKFQMLEITFSK